MADRHWVGGTANWDGTAGTKWALTNGGAGGQAIPTSADDVFFDSGSGANTVTISAGNTGAKSINCTGFTGTLAGSAAISVAGSVTLVSGMAGYSYTGTMTINNTSGTATINSGTKTMDHSFTFNGVGGTFQLAASLTSGATRVLTLTNGTLDLNDKTFAIGTFTSNNANTRALTFGAGGTGILELTNASGTTTVWNTGDQTNFTINNADVGVLKLSGANSSTRTVSMDSSPAVNGPSILVTNGSGGFTLTGLCNDLTFEAGYTGAWSNSVQQIRGSLTLHGGMSVASGALSILLTATSGTKTITSAGLTIDAPVNFNGSGGAGGTWQLADALTLGSTRQLTLTAGTLDANDKNVTAATFVSSTSNTRAIDFGSGTWTLVGNAATIWSSANSSGLTITRGNPVVLNYSGSTGTRTISTATGESISIDFNITAGTDSVALGHARHVDFTGFAGTLTNTARTIYGNLTISSGMTLTAGANATTFGATSGTNTITTNSVVADFPVTINGAGGTFQLADSFTSGATRALTLSAGTFDLNGKTATFGTFSSNNSTTRALTFGAGTLVLSNASGTTTIWNTTDQTNLTVNVNTGSISVNGANSSDRTIVQDSSPVVTIPSITVSAGSGGITTTNVNTVDLTFTSGYTGIWTNSVVTLSGSLSLNAANGAPASSSSALTFAATSGTKTITSGGKTLNFPVTLDGVGGTFQLVDALTLGATRGLVLTNGTFDANGQAVSTGSFSSSNSNIRVLTMGNGLWTLLGSGTVWNVSTPTNLTFNKGTSNIKLTDTSATAKTFSGGDLTYNDVWFAGGAGGSSAIISGDNTFADLKMDTTGGVLVLPGLGTTTVATMTIGGSGSNKQFLESDLYPSTAVVAKSGGVEISFDHVSVLAIESSPIHSIKAGINSISRGDNKGVDFYYVGGAT